MPLDDAVERFEKNVHPEPMSGCFLWGASTNPDGYGRLRVAMKLVQAHRFAYERAYGPICGKCVLHKCDVPSCVNPNHLFLGTRNENNKDMKAKGRVRFLSGDEWYAAHPKQKRRAN